MGKILYTLLMPNCTGRPAGFVFALHSSSLGPSSSFPFSALILFGVNVVDVVDVRKGR